MKVRVLISGGIEPIDNKEIFKHCAQGNTRVTVDYFAAEVIPLLSAHNINSITYINELTLDLKE